MEHEELDKYAEQQFREERFIVPEPPTADYPVPQDKPKSVFARTIDKVLRKDQNAVPEPIPQSKPQASFREAEIDLKLAEVNQKLAVLTRVMNQGVAQQAVPEPEVPVFRVEPPTQPPHAKPAQGVFVLRVPQQELSVPRDKLQDVVNTLHGLGARIENIQPKER